jgi:hypothetical protein
VGVGLHVLSPTPGIPVDCSVAPLALLCSPRFVVDCCFPVILGSCSLFRSYLVAPTIDLAISDAGSTSCCRCLVAVAVMRLWHSCALSGSCRSLVRCSCGGGGPHFCTYHSCGLQCHKSLLLAPLALVVVEAGTSCSLVSLPGEVVGRDASVCSGRWESMGVILRLSPHLRAVGPMVGPIE